MAQVKSKKSDVNKMWKAIEKRKLAHSDDVYETVIKAFKDSLLYGEGFIKVYPTGDIQHIPHRKHNGAKKKV